MSISMPEFYTFTKYDNEIIFKEIYLYHPVSNYVTFYRTLVTCKTSKQKFTASEYVGRKTNSNEFLLASLFPDLVH